MFPLSLICSFTSMFSIRAELGSKLTGVMLGTAIIGLSLAPLPAAAGASITTINQDIEAALEAASTARAAYISYSTAATDGCSAPTDNRVNCVVSSSERQVADAETRAVHTPPRK